MCDETRPPRAEKNPANGTRELGDGMAKSKVLIIEDDPDLTDVLAYNLRQAGYEVLSARDGAEGLRQARLVLPDIVLLDLMLPLLDGLEVCRRLRSESATADL